MDTATQGQGLFVNAAGIIYASFGFSLSVITALLNLLFHRSNAQHELILTLPSHPKPAHSPRPHVRPRRPMRSLSEHSIEVALPVPELSSRSQASPSEKQGVIFHRTSLPSTPVRTVYHYPEMTTNAQSPESPSEKRRGPYLHGRSHSIPIIMVDHFDSTEQLTWTSPDASKVESPISVPITPLSKPESLISPPSSARTTSTTKSNSSNTFCSAATTGKPKPRLFDPKSWGKDKRLKRCQSSPQLTKPPELSFITSVSHKPTGSNPETPPATLKKSKSWKGLRKAKSGPVNDKTVPKVDRKSEKKRSQTLRTHPYEAPYFAPPPVPPLPVHITFISDHTTSDSSSVDSSPKSSLDRKSSKLLRAKS